MVEAVQGLGTTTLITNYQNEHQAADLELESILKEAKRKGQLAPGDVPAFFFDNAILFIIQCQ